MEKQLKVVLIGAGAVGLLCAAPLASAENILFRVAAGGERLERRRREGLFLNDRKLPVKFLPLEEKFVCDFLLIATKSYGYREALEQAVNFIGPETVIIPLLNGISSVGTARELYPDNPCVCGFFLGHASVRVGNHVRHDGSGCFYIGSVDGGALPEAVKASAELFRRGGIRCETPENMLSALWRKYILNIGVNQTSALFRSDYGTLQRHPDQLDFAMGLMKEASAIAEKNAVPGAAAMPEEAMKVILSMPGDAKTSMLQDVENGCRTEIDLFAGTLCRLGRKYGIPTPLNDRVMRSFSTERNEK